MKIHFIAGLPRAGKTMLAAVLRQNPRFFHFGMESPVCDILMAVERASSRNNELTWVLGEGDKIRLRRGVFEAIYGRKSEVCFDTCRFWTAKMPLLATLFPDFKMICCVRSIAWVMDSFERLYQSSAGTEMSGIHSFNAGTTVFSRCAQLAASDGVVGKALDALREAYYGAHSSHLMLVDYVSLTDSPRLTMKRIYEFCEEPVYLHDFDSLRAENDKFDVSIGSPNLHRIPPRVNRVSRETLLPPMLFERFLADDFWLQPRSAPKVEVA